MGKLHRLAEPPYCPRLSAYPSEDALCPRHLPAAPPFLIAGHAGHYQNSFAGRNLGRASSAGQWPQLPAVRRHALSVWDGTVLAGKTASFNGIASAEGLAERHIRRLVPLAFLSPKIIQAIADGTGPAGLTVSSLTQALPHAWTAQEQMLGLS